MKCPESLITQVENALYKIPLPTPMEDATHGLMTQFDLMITKITNQDGLVGCGYTFTTDLAAKAIYSVAEDEIAPLILKKDADRIEQLWNMVNDRLYYVGRGGIVSFALSAVDIALWDLFGKRCGMPLWKLVGGRQGFVRAYGGGVDLNLSPDALVANVQEYLSRGHRAVKIKVGKQDLEEDLARVAAVKDSLPPNVTLMADANCGWTAAQACRAARALEPFGLYWLEEPCAPDDLRGYAQLSKISSIPLAMGENFRSLDEFDRMLTYGHCDHPQPDVSNIGGITAFIKLSAAAQTRHLNVSTHGMQEINVSLLSGIANPGYLEIHAFPISDFTTWKVTVQDGIALPPDVPGTGVSFDERRLAPYRVM